MSSRPASSRSILVFDFDGTVALGEGPVLAYARRMAAELGEPAGFAELVEAALAAGGEESLDGYDAVRRIAQAHGARDDQLSRAFLASRAELGTERAPIVAPTGLAAFLEAARAEAGAEHVLVTNSPAIRIPEAIEALGLAGLFDRVVTDAGKPAGLGAVLDALAERRADARLLSVGDIWRNDLAPAHERGHATALVGPFADPAATPTFRAADTAAVLPALRSWLDL